MKKSDFVVKLIDPKETQYLRHKVLWPHISNQKDCVIDIDDRLDGIHLGAFDGERIVSIASFFKLSSHKIAYKIQYRLRAMATDPDYRRKGAGKVIILKAIEILKEKRIDVLWCNAREVALEFYISIGFEVIDEWYDVPLIGPHKFMYFPLQK